MQASFFWLKEMPTVDLRFSRSWIQMELNITAKIQIITSAGRTLLDENYQQNIIITVSINQQYEVM